MKAYLSSTYEDLKDYRQRAYDELRKLEFDVLAMEHYGAANMRPVDKCLADVGSADLYIGIFAHRYGFVPDAENPGHRSITELEYRHAVERNIPRLIFLVPSDANWNLQFSDAFTGEGDQGRRIAELREDLAKKHVFEKFTTPDELAAAVASSSAKWLNDRKKTPPASAEASTQKSASPYPRQILSDLLLLHMPSDGDSAAALAKALSSWSIRRSETGLMAASLDELESLDRLVASARLAAVLLSPSALTLLAEDPERSRRVLGLARDRTGGLLAVALNGVSSDDAEAWAPGCVVGPSSPADGFGDSRLAFLLYQALAQRLPDLEVPLVGLPVVFVAMTEPEAASLLAAPPDPVSALLKRAGGSTAKWTARYGQSRSAWKPFAGADDTIEQVLSHAVAEVNRDANSLQGRAVQPQPYPLDALMRDKTVMWPMYRNIARRGCLVVVDELSLFHEQVRQAFLESPLRYGEQVAFVTLSPFDPAARSPFASIRKHLDGYLEQATQRFGDLDPLCEMGIPERRRLDRWLHRSLPRAVEALREAKQDPQKLREFSEELGIRPSPGLGRLMAGEGGPG